MGTSDRQLAQLFADLARSLVSHAGVDATVGGICRLAVDTIAGCRSAGISLVHRGGRIETPAATDQLAYDLHNLQYDLAEGPCLDAVWQQHTVEIEDMVGDERWPRFAARATDRGVRSMLCFQLFTAENSLGALDMFSDQPNDFDDDDREVGLIFASHAAVALSSAQVEAHLTEAISSRQRIGEATGILAERYGLSTASAFALLAQVSQDHNIKVRELAVRLVTAEDDSRRDPDRPDTPPTAENDGTDRG